MKDKILEYANSIRVVDYKLVSTTEEGYLGKSIYEVTLANGKKKRVERILKDKGDGDAVVILPITKDGKFIIEVQSRPNLVDNNGVAIEFPAGMVDQDERFVDAAKRELLEETGYVAKEFRELEWHYQDQGCSNAIIKSYVALDCEKVSQQKLDDDEVLEPLEITFDELLELYDSKLINDASSKIVVLTYMKQKKGL